ncbi:MAG TPA: DUF2817 domain-containing protein [Paucimonas sp.]|nr:DUF2817 domain-containing protein [Paucimonas sp.]
MALPADYPESRAIFLEHARRLGVEARSFFHADDDSGARLSTDVAVFGPGDARAAVFIASGTHGVEGYAGAACQFRFMEIYPQRYARPDIDYVLVHAVNPWGYFHDCRVTRENVDLNRNFVEFPLGDGRDGGYGAYHDLLVARYRPWPRGLWNEIRLLSCALTGARRRRLQAAITAGQHAYPDGLFYGGTAATESRRIWEDIVRLHGGGRGRAVLLDLHTGLGRRGSGELISHLPPSDPGFLRMNAWFGGALRSMAGGSVGTAVEGTLNAAFERMLAGRGQAVGLEFGTRAPLAVLNALRADQWYRNHAGALSTAERARVRRKMKNAFAIPDAAWCDAVLARFEQVVEQLARGLATDQR